MEVHRVADQYEPLYRVNEEAATFYQRALAAPKGSRASLYLAKRGVDEAARTSFRLGLSPAGMHVLKTHLSSVGFDQDAAVQAGLLRRGEDGSVRDFFWGRLMFPIQDSAGRVIGFGGRARDGVEPKYINTPESPIFAKRANLYGLHLAIQPIRDSNTAVVVEGYMDAIAAHQAGFSNVVASMGTALTERQVGMLRAVARRFVLALDPDDAGLAATLRSLEVSWKVLERTHAQPNADLAIASLPTGQDPDTLIRRDPGEWERTVAAATPYVDFMIRAVSGQYDLGQLRARVEAAFALAPVITAGGTASDQERYFQLTADTLGVSRSALEGTIGPPMPTLGGQARPLPVSHGGHDYVALLLRRPDLRDGVEGGTNLA